MNIFRNAGLLTCAAVLFLFVGCVSVVEKAGQIIDGSAFEEKTTAVYRTAGMEIREVRNKAGDNAVIITLENFPAMQLRGSAPDAQGEFFLTSLDYLSGSPQGWNEYRLDLSGYGTLTVHESSAVLSIPDEIEPVQITAGRIRRYDTRITGNEALTNLRNRRERIIALTEWMNERENAPQDQSRAAFEAYWKPVLFPELVSKKKRPDSWQQEGDQRIKAEDIRWNTGYTQRLFPEDLIAIRNSGTMLRDWEEAFEWIYMEYEWSRIQELLAGETTLRAGTK